MANTKESIKLAEGITPKEIDEWRIAISNTYRKIDGCLTWRDISEKQRNELTRVFNYLELACSRLIGIDRM